MPTATLRQCAATLEYLDGTAFAKITAVEHQGEWYGVFAWGHRGAGHAECGDPPQPCDGQWEALRNALERLAAEFAAYRSELTGRERLTEAARLAAWITEQREDLER